MLCPDDDALISLLLRGDDSIAASHVRDCGTCRARLDAFRLQLRISLAELAFDREPVVPTDQETVAKVMQRVHEKRVAVDESRLATVSSPEVRLRTVEQPVAKPKSWASRWTIAASVVALLMATWLIRSATETSTASDKSLFAMTPIETDRELSAEKVASIHAVDADHWRIEATKIVRIRLACSEHGFAKILVIHAEGATVYPMNQIDIELLPNEARVIAIPSIGKKMIVIGVVSKSHLSSLLSSYSDGWKRDRSAAATAQTVSDEVREYLRVSGAVAPIIRGQEWEFIP